MVRSVKQVSQILHTNPKFIYERINLGLLPALKPRSSRVRKESLEEFFRKHDGCDPRDPQNVKKLVTLP